MSTSLAKLIASLTILLAGLTGTHSGLLGNTYPSGGSVGASTPQTSLYYVDGNRTDPYTQTGNILTPYKTFSSAISAAAADAYNGGSFYLNETNAPYVDGAADTFPTSVYVNGNQSTYVPASGATFPGTAEIYDIVTAGNLTFSNTSTAQLHQINNSTIASGNVVADGLINMIGTSMVSTTSTLTIASTGLMNYIGGQLDATINSAAQSNYNDMEWDGSTSTYGIVQSGCANGGCMNVVGMTYINTAGNGINVASSGASVASGTSNNLIDFSEVLGANATSSVNAGSAYTAVCDSQGFYTVTGAFIYPVGTNWNNCINEKSYNLYGETIGVGNATSTLPAVGNLLTVITPSSTVRIGVTSTWPGCIELYDAGASGTLDYIYSSGTTLVDTASKPTFCQ